MTTTHAQHMDHLDAEQRAGDLAELADSDLPLEPPLSPEDEEALPADDGCRCAPCESGGTGYPWLEHCAACCFGTRIEEYHPECAIAGHRAMAERQFPSDPERTAA